MFFSVDDLYKAGKTDHDVRWTVASFFGMDYYATPSKRHYAEYVRKIKKAILQRDYAIANAAGYRHHIGKWLRPWDVVPSLQNFSAPDGEYAVGVEIELGFRDRNSSRAVAKHLEHWKHVALDYEGGRFPIEATFPPVPYSKFNGQSQPARYLKWLSDNPHLVQNHAEDALVGTHVNVSSGDHAIVSSGRLMRISDVMSELSYNDKRKYFGRGYPYRYARTDSGKYIEFKMFNSTTDWKVLRRYVDISVELAKLAYSREVITEDVVRAALEAGYNKRSRKKKANVINESPELAQAA